MTDETTAAAAITQPPTEPSSVAAPSPANSGCTMTGNTITGATAAGGEQSAGATSDPSAQAQEQAMEDTWREQLVDAVVARLQQKALAAAPAPSAPPAAPKASMGRVVHFRDGVGNDHAAIITGVTTEGVSLTVFRSDALPFGVQNQTEIDPSSPGAYGWFWPPRV